MVISLLNNKENVFMPVTPDQGSGKRQVSHERLPFGGKDSNLQSMSKGTFFAKPEVTLAAPAGLFTSNDMPMSIDRSADRVSSFQTPLPRSQRRLSRRSPGSARSVISFGCSKDGESTYASSYNLHKDPSFDFEHLVGPDFALERSAMYPGPPMTDYEDGFEPLENRVYNPISMQFPDSEDEDDILHLRHIPLEPMGDSPVQSPVKAPVRRTLDDLIPRYAGCENEPSASLRDVSSSNQSGTPSMAASMNPPKPLKPPQSISNIPEPIKKSLEIDNMADNSHLAGKYRSRVSHKGTGERPKSYMASTISTEAKKVPKLHFR